MQAATTTKVEGWGHRSPNFAKEVPTLCIAPVKAVFGSVGILFAMIGIHFLLFCDGTPKSIRSQDTMISKLDYVELELA